MSRHPPSLTSEHTVLGPLGSGGRGMVWHTRRRSDHSEWAVKVLHQPSPSGVARMKAEYRTLVRADHPAVVRPGRLWVSGDQAWFSMQYVAQAASLPRWAGKAGLRERWRPETYALIRPLIAQLVESIVAIHRTGVVHRDIKPDNVLVDANGRVFLLDLDLAAPPTDAAVAGRILGTPGYRAPELSLGLPVGPAADWFGLGTVLYELFTGRAPFGLRPRSALRAQRRRGAPDLAVARPDVPAPVAHLVTQLLHSDAPARPQLHQILAQFGARAPRAEESTLAALRRAHAGPGSWVDMRGNTPQMRRAALSDSEPASAWRIGLRFGLSTDPHLGPVDALASGLVRLLHQMPRELRAQVLPRDPAILLRAVPELATLPELLARATPSTAGDPSPLAELTARLSMYGSLTLHLEDIHKASTTDLTELGRVLGGATRRLRVITEGESVEDPALFRSLSTLRARFSSKATVRCTRALQSPVKPAPI